MWPLFPIVWLLFLFRMEKSNNKFHLPRTFLHHSIVQITLKRFLVPFIILRLRNVTNIGIFLFRQIKTLLRTVLVDEALIRSSSWKCPFQSFDCCNHHSKRFAGTYLIYNLRHGKICLHIAMFAEGWDLRHHISGCNADGWTNTSVI